MPIICGLRRFANADRMKKSEEKVVKIKITTKQLFDDIWIKALIFVTVFNSFYTSIINKVGVSSFLSVIFLILLCFGAYGLGHVQLYVKDTIITLVLFLLCLLNVMIFNVKIDDYMITFFSFLFMIIASGSIDYEKHQNYILSISSLYILVLFVYRLFFYRTTVSSDYFNDMGFAYYITPSAIIVIYNFFRDRKIKHLILLIMSAFFLFICGTRGAILCCVLFVIYCIIMEMQKIKTHKKWILFAALLLVLIAIINFRHIAAWTYPFLKENGFSTRWMRYLRSEGGLFETSGRDVIIKIVKDNIFKHPILGGGLMEDRILMGGYSHNIILELLNSFGIPLGAILFIALLFLIIYSYIKTKSTVYKYYIVAFTCVSVVKLMVSSSFMQESSLYILIGICFRALRCENENGVANK